MSIKQFALIISIEGSVIGDISEGFSLQKFQELHSHVH
jgi:hypothetical protein